VCVEFSVGFEVHVALHAGDRKEMADLRPTDVEGSPFFPSQIMGTGMPLSLNSGQAV